MTPALDVMFDVLARASLAGAVVALAAWVLCAAVGRLSAAARCTIWWLVSLKLVIGLAWIDPVLVPVLPPAPPTATIVAALAAAVDDPGVPSNTLAPTVSWRAVAMVVWMAGLMVAATRTLRECRRVSSIRSHARSAGRPTAEMVRALSARAGLFATPDVCLSDDIETPMVTGLLRSVIILPARRWPTLSAAEQEMALCHELAHLGRVDLWLGLVPSLAERIFFFHPLAHLAAREYVVAREAACDTAVLRVLEAAPREYGRLLITLGISPLPGGASASGAAHSFSSLKRRIAMLDHGSPTLTARVAGWMLALVALAALVPLQLVARPAETPSATPEQSAVSTQTHTSGSGLDYTLVLGEKDGTIMSGQLEEVRIRAEREGHGRVLWFRSGGKTYEVRDPAAIDQAAAIVHPMTEIGRQQGEIGAKQGAIGAQQGVVGARQGEIGARQGAVGAQQGVLGAREGALGAKEAHELSAAEKAQIEREHEQIDREMRELNAKMAALDTEMREAEKSMPDLDGQMEVLSRQMDVLSRKMTEASARADSEMRALAEKLVKLGIAKPIN